MSHSDNLGQLQHQPRSLADACLEADFLSPTDLRIVVFEGEVASELSGQVPFLPPVVSGLVGNSDFKNIILVIPCHCIWDPTYFFYKLHHEKISFAAKQWSSFAA